ncbi:hypothetical protein S40293_03938 [Stachybotrys chartarum IBT 40293]|nr:hypothetical protein S40293_03938 [Stachybotrys chartarum IBT 40293]
MSEISLTPPVFEHHHNGLGVEASKPRISWRFSASLATTGWVQTAYDIQITFASNPEDPKTYHVASEDSVLVPWPARALGSREAASVRVRVYGKGNNRNDPEEPSTWSSTSQVEAALLSQDDFKAHFITSSHNFVPQGPLQPIRFRRSFGLPDHLGSADALRARLYITALGVFDVWINGKLVSDECMAPGWTSYKHRLAYRVLDISHALLPNQENVICAEVGEGWYAGRLGFMGGERYRYGNELALFAQLEVHANASDMSEPWRLLTDETWTTTASAIVTSEIYDGEVYNLANEVNDWTSTTADWTVGQVYGVRTLPRPLAKLVAPDAPPVRVVKQVACKEVFKSNSGKTILDFGQNLVGKLCITSLDLGNGQKLTLQHAEVMENGELGIRPLREAKSTDTILGCKGKRLESWSPKFTFHGFRFVQVDGWPTEKLKIDDIHALVIHTDMRRRGHFECSNAAVNQLHSNVVWSMRGNFVSIPTDCPQRDERLGWTGDIQAFCPTATFLYDTLGMLGSWLQDVAAEQLQPEAGGVVPLVVPEAMPLNWPAEANPQAIWGDVAVLVPDALYQYSSDTGLLDRQFASMKAWLEQGIKRAPDGLWEPSGFQLADWLDPQAPPDDPAQASTDSLLVANAYLVYVTRVFAKLCTALEKHNLATKYANDSTKLKECFQRRYITPDGNLVSLSQTGIALAIQFGLYPDNAPPRALAAGTLERLVRKARFHISTGFAGTPVITHALTTIGRPQLAYGMLLETGCPSWLYPVVRHNATTIWERWDSMLPDGRINPGEMTSFNHYALGAVADWLHGSVGGISPLTPGWKAIRVRPVPGGNLTSARVSFDGPYGLVACRWTLEHSSRGDDEKEFRMTLTVPPNCSAVVTLPSELKMDYDMEEEASRVVGSGIHEFECVCKLGAWPPKALGHPFKPEPTNDFAGE